MPVPILCPSEAARALGISAKALRLYERHRLLVPPRTAAGWRTYGPREMTRAAEIVALRRLGFGLAEIVEVLHGEAADYVVALARHEATLRRRLCDVADTVARVRSLRNDLASGPASAAPAAVFDLPWPWGGERFVLPRLAALTYLVGPLGSGKTRLARAIARAVPGAVFLGLDRADGEAAEARARLAADAGLRERVARRSADLVGTGARPSSALTALLVALEAPEPSALVVDMVEHGLDRPTQAALAAHLRARSREDGARPLVLMTRSSVILDLDTLEPGEAILFCPANHSPPAFPVGCPGTPGHEALASCLGAPEVRARTEGMVAVRSIAGEDGSARSSAG